MVFPSSTRAPTTLYLLSKSQSAGPIFHQRLNAVDLVTGNEKFSGSIEISATVSGTGDGSSSGKIDLPLDVRALEKRSVPFAPSPPRGRAKVL